MGSSKRKGARREATQASAVSSAWKALNDELRTADEARCEELLKVETKGYNRQTFLLRIHSRLNKVRAVREREELKQGDES